MHRSFATSTKRRQVYLDGIWDFCVDAEDVGVSEEWCAKFPRETTPLWVPGVWNTQRGMLHYEGVAWYRRRFTLEEPAQTVALHFAAVAHQANVWLDGEPLGEHYGGFLPFSFLIPEIEPGEHELIVRVDSTHDMTTTIPAAKLDWARYGGIIRPVWVEALASVGYVRSLRLIPVVRDGRASLRVRAELVNLSERLVDESWTLYLDGQAQRSDRVELQPGGAQVLRFAVRLEDAPLWSPAEPNLCQVRLAFAGDDLIDRVGFRELTISGSDVLLNGQPIQIRGVNRHEDHPEWGFALPPHLMLRDLSLLEDLGANAVRGSHYPNDQRFLDYCDERGILFLEEIPLWGYDREQLAEDIILDRAAAMLWAMIDRDANHPSIWAWSVLNECATDTREGRTMVQQLVDTAHDLDPTRPVTYASNRGMADVCFDLVDLVCVNAYHGWYTHDVSWEQFVDEVRAMIGSKPLIVSEFGAGALPGWRSIEEAVIWSEEYQRDLLRECLQLFLSRSDLLGFYVWQFCDTRTCDGQRTLQRPRSFNNKGLLNEYRQPKLAYETVRSLLIKGQSTP